MPPCARFLSLDRQRHATRERGPYAAIDRTYGNVLRWSLRHRWVIVLLSVLTVASTVPLFTVIGKDFLPQDDQSEFEVIVQTPEGYSLQRTDAAFHEIENRLRARPGVTHLLTTIGDSTGQLRAGEGPVTTGSVYVRLLELDDRNLSQAEVMRRARASLAEFADLRLSVQAVNLFMGGGQRHTEIEFDLTGPGLHQLETYADRIMAGMRAMPGFVDVDTTLSVRQPELRVNLSRQKAAEFGIDVEDVASTLRTLVGGERVSTWREEQEQYDVWLRAQRTNREDVATIGDLSVATPGGKLVKLANLATLSEERGPSQIDHYSRQRTVTIVANLVGLALSDAVQRVDEIIKGLDLPPTYRAELGGRAKALGESGQNFLSPSFSA